MTIGAYTRGSSLHSDIAIEMQPVIMEFLAQVHDASVSFPETCRGLVNLATTALQMHQQSTAAGGAS